MHYQLQMIISKMSNLQLIQFLKKYNKSMINLVFRNQKLISLQAMKHLDIVAVVA
jgi:hypothetical protein